MKILLTGKNGQIGWELQRTLGSLGEVIAPGRENMDLADPDSIRAALREVKPDLIVNAAAYTAVDQAESEEALALAVNGIAPGIMAEEARRIGAAMVHYSTDYVFDGKSSSPYTEDDAPAPLNVYGKTKLAGEEAVRAAGIPYLILRTSWVYGARGRNFLLTMLRLMREKDELRVVNDQIGAPTWSRMIAAATAGILAQLAPSGSGVSLEGSGTYHLTARGQTSWYGFAKAILGKAAELHMLGVGRTLPMLIPVATAEYPLPAGRPAYSVLANEKIMRAFGVALPEWEASLALCLEDMSRGSNV